jgi:hypothetical protein
MRGTAKRSAKMSNADDLSGYKKPPSNSRFRKGASGNPKGRPKGLTNLATLMERALHERVAAHENGKRRMITKAEVISKQLINKAASGDLRALSQLSKLHFLAAEFVTQKEVDISMLPYHATSSGIVGARMGNWSPGWSDSPLDIAAMME